MIIDSNLVLIDHLTEEEIGSAGQNMSRAVPLTSFLEPGRQGPIPIVVQLSDGLVDSETITFTLFQGDTEAEANNSSSEDGWEEIGTFTASGPMKKGCRIGWRFLPRSVTKQWLRLQVGATGEKEKDKEDEKKHPFAAPAFIISSLFGKRQETGKIGTLVVLHESKKPCDITHGISFHSICRSL